MVSVLDLKGRMEASTSKGHMAFVPTPKCNAMRPESMSGGKFGMGTLLNKKDMGIDLINSTNDDEDAEIDIINGSNDDEDVEVDIMNCRNDEDVEVDIINCTKDDEDVEVDIINCTNDAQCALVPSHSDDATASSSSFGDINLDFGNHEFESDNEAMSELRGDGAPLPGLDGSGDLFLPRKKKVTSHWRKFVQPIMWRCKWVELQLRKFQSVAVKYDKELENYKQTHHLKYGNFELEGRCAKSVPFFHDSHREKPMKRKKRRSHEEMDTDAFMSQHSLFSYFATCRSPSHGPAMDDDQPNQAPSTDKNVGNEFRVPDELLSLEFRDDYSLEQILWKIEVSQSQVSQMKARINALMAENAGRISVNEELIMQQSNNTFMEPEFPTRVDKPSVVADFASQLIKLNTGDDLVKPDDLVRPENASFGHQEGYHLQDANEPMEQPPFASRKRSSDGILIYNRRAKKPQTDSGPVKIHPIENLQVRKEEKSNHSASVSVSEDSSQNEQPAVKLRSISNLTASKSTKKRATRARRKSSANLWTRRNPG
uniref:uncharacterized protein LOC122597778 n=1 Tax=Erigeron canadensis TaxID=72917 RepID=UPI001CB99336|nr:uncharacterized protein LOC122597778 [Erigeron canadensis]